MFVTSSSILVKQLWVGQTLKNTQKIVLVSKANSTDVKSVVQHLQVKMGERNMQET